MEENALRKIRPATLDDFAQLAEIKIEVFPPKNQQHHSMNASLKELFINEFKKRWLRQWEHGFNILILTDNKLIVGLISYSTPDSKDLKANYSAEINNIYVLEKMRGKGLGKLLCKAAINKIQQEKYREIVVWILEDSHAIRQFYEGLGFRSTQVFRTDKIRQNLFLKEVKYQLILA